MANRNAPRGFRPVRHASGGCIQLSGVNYSIATDYSTKIHTGDVVQLTGTGKNVAIAEAGNVNNQGVFAGCSYVDVDGAQQFSSYWPGTTTNTNIKAFLYDDPNIIYEVQVDTIAEADVGNMMDLAEGTGSDVTGQSGSYLDESTKATSGTAFLVLGLVDRVGNGYGAYAQVECVFGEHSMGRVISGVGGV